MARMVRDYPELAGQIGNMKKDSEFGTSMAAGSTFGGRMKANIMYNAFNDKKGALPTSTRFVVKGYDKSTGYSAAGEEYDGNHELGHVLNSLLLNPHSLQDAKHDWRHNVTANDMLEHVLSSDSVMSPKERKKLVRHKHDEDGEHLAGQINLKKSGLQELGITSGYGASNAGEFFAEAFADVYAHGNKAKKASIKLLKVYEKKRKNLLRRLNAQKKRERW